jgi:hypothetical protein
MVHVVVTSEYFSRPLSRILKWTNLIYFTLLFRATTSITVKLERVKMTQVLESGYRTQIYESSNHAANLPKRQKKYFQHICTGGGGEISRNACRKSCRGKPAVK